MTARLRGRGGLPCCVFVPFLGVETNSTILINRHYYHRYQHSRYPYRSEINNRPVGLVMVCSRHDLGAGATGQELDELFRGWVASSNDLGGRAMS